VAKRGTRGRKPASTTALETVQAKVVEHRRELSWAAMSVMSLFAVVSLASFHPDDATWLRPIAGVAPIHNRCGSLGANVADLLYRSLGVGAWLAVVVGVVVPFFQLARRPLLRWGQWLLVVWSTVVGLGLVELAMGTDVAVIYPPGGAVGLALSGAVRDVVGVVGAWMLLGAAWIGSLSVLFGVSWGLVALALLDRLEAGLPELPRGDRPLTERVGALLGALLAGISSGAWWLVSSTVLGVWNALDRLGAATRRTCWAIYTSTRDGTRRGLRRLVRDLRGTFARMRASFGGMDTADALEGPPSVATFNGAMDALDDLLDTPVPHSAVSVATPYVGSPPPAVPREVSALPPARSSARGGAAPAPGLASPPQGRGPGAPAALSPMIPAPSDERTEVAPPSVVEVHPEVVLFGARRGQAKGRAAHHLGTTGSPIGAPAAGSDPVTVQRDVPTVVAGAGRLAEVVVSPTRGSGVNIAFTPPTPPAPPVEASLGQVVRRGASTPGAAPGLASRGAPGFPVDAVDADDAPTQGGPPAVLRAAPGLSVGAAARARSPHGVDEDEGDEGTVDPQRRLDWMDLPHEGDDGDDDGSEDSESLVSSALRGAAAGPGRSVRPESRTEMPSLGDGEIQVEAAEGLELRVVDDGGAVADRSTLYFELPALNLLDPVPEQHATINEDDLRELALTVEASLASFKVTGKVTNVRVGPVVTTFEYLPDQGISVRRIAGLQDDLAMALCAVSVRVVAPIPGKGVVGIEIPSTTRMTIYLRELLASEEFRTTQAALPVILGKDVEGRPMVADLAKMPHVLIGGTTGSGKSVGVNGMLMSLLFTRTPEELRLLLVDPKKLEFESYADVPHLLHPVVTEAKGAAAALAWACREMDRRYELLARWATRNISNYNKKVEREARQWTREKARRYAPKDWPEDVPAPQPEVLPYIVIVIDELADLMMVAKKDVQDSIVRLAQMARACGMHLMIATQRPSVDVVTGIIKSNLPTRMSFKLRSVIDSRTILDQGGAEKLLGQGDMLYLPGAGEVQRCHGPFVSDDEVNRVMDFLRAQREPDYIETITADPAEAVVDEVDPTEQDDLFNEAVDIVLKSGKASTSMIQRHLKIGYNRAARIVDLMEQAGIVGPADGSRPRDVLIGPNAH
jgi:DNA segregation ATPase FtsK/SpoIIIE-like protein